ncbi:MAG: hypothetical protein R2932_00855 [Caldilineaceae bacterium]
MSDVEMDQVLQPDLADRIAAARQAKAQVNEAQQLEAQAAELPALLREQRRLERLEQLRPAADRAELEARTILERTAPKIKQWRERWAAAHDELLRLAGELPALQDEIAFAARHAHTAADFRQEIAGAPVAGNDDLPGNDIPLALGANGFADIWERVGGANPDLAPLPSREEMKQEQLLKMLSAGQIMTVYRPAIGARLMRGRF